MDKELTIVFLKYLQREPTIQEVHIFSNKLISSSITLKDVENEIKQLDEYKVLCGISVEVVEYDSVNNSISVSKINKKEYEGVFVANGKIGIKTSYTPFYVEKCVISTNFKDSKIKEYHNTVNTYDFTSIKLSNDYMFDESSYKQVLNMQLGTVRHEYNYIKDSYTTLSINKDMFAFRNSPFCFNIKIEISNLSLASVTFDLYHSIIIPDNIKESEVINDKIGNINYFSAKGYDKDKKIDILNNNAYLMNGVKLKGMNTDDSNVFEITLDAGTSTEIIILSFICTSDDFNNPYEESLKMLSNIHKDYDSFVIDHNERWISLWNKSDIILVEADTIEINKLFEIEYIQKQIKYGLYGIFSIIREDINVDINPLNLSVLDVTGKIYWNAEMFLIPIMLILNPNVARELINLRFVQIEQLKQLTSAYGNKGINIPFNNQYIETEIENPLYIINSGLLSVHVWNYYRTSNDIEWLETKGYKIIKHCALFFSSLLEPLYNKQTGKVYSYNVKKVYTLNNNEEANNVMTIILAKRTFENYLQSTYRLNYTPISTLKDNFDFLQIPYKSLTLNNNKYLPTRFTIDIADDEMYFYDSITNELIGKSFGNLHKSYLIVNDETTYIVDISSDLFLDFLNDKDERIPFLNESSVVVSNNGFTNGYVYIDGHNLHTIKCINKYIHDIFTTNIFKRRNNSILLNNVLDIHSNYNREEIDILETHLLLMNYYADNSITPTVVMDNMLYYKELYNKTQTINDLILNNLNIYLSQNLVFSTERSYMQYLAGKNLYENIKKTDTPWGNFDDMYLYLFNILYGIAAFKFQGIINEQNYFVESIDLVSTFTGRLPATLSTVKIKYNNIEIILNDNSS